MAPPPARVLAELYAVAPGAFTRERNAKAAALAKAGRADEASAVKQLRRPPISLWATNQLARADSRRLAAFLAAVARLRATQLRDPRAGAETVREQREHLRALVQRAGEILQSERHRLTPAIERRISDTLLGAAADQDLADDLRHGRLEREVPAPGFDALLGAPGAGHRPPVRTSAKAGQPAEEERRRQRAQVLADEAAAREAAAQQLEREITAAATALTEQKRRLRAAQQEAKRAAAAVRKGRSGATT